MTHPSYTVTNRPQNTADTSSWRLPGFILLSLIFHLAVVTGFFLARPEPSLVMAGREGGVVAMTLLSVAEAKRAAATAAPAQETMPEPESQPQSEPQAPAASVTVPDAVIPLRTAPPQKSSAEQPVRPQRAQTPPREKPPRVKPQREARPEPQAKRATPAAAKIRPPEPVRETPAKPAESTDSGQATQKKGNNTAQHAEAKGATSSISAAITGSSSSGNASQGAGNSNNQNFKALHRRVNYPQRAKALGVEGRVRIKFDVTASGTVTNVRILSETPRGVFARAIQADIARWRYRTQQAVSDQVVSIVFRLNGQVQLEN